MLSKSFGLVAVGCFLAASSAAWADGEPRLVPSPIEKVFVPQGFDDNDNVEVVLHGHFPNSCYKVGPVTAQFDAATNTYTVEARSYYYTGGMLCAQMVVPFIQTASLGLAAQGTYKVVVKGRPVVEARPLDVVHSHSRGPDDYLYAPVAVAGLKTTNADADQVVVEGEYPYMFIGCMEIREIRTSLTPDNVVIVQPIAELRGDADCVHHRPTFAFTQSLGQKLPDGEYVVHVRTLNGNSLNRFVDLTGK